MEKEVFIKNVRWDKKREQLLEGILSSLKSLAEDMKRVGRWETHEMKKKKKKRRGEAEQLEGIYTSRGTHWGDGWSLGHCFWR
ncbi:hypothetical protein VIGAN_01188900 [Vigna angularis var. angularis]|uniref:Uncharacterized protein n=1 Tax=Vigna angularis var. angularis TaxID=157739 RepID=A0A0S3R0T4_PHAAN|nr:hypothetical protein VIGAN_01188900 [Vigna angularis var. angularis]